MLDCTTITEDGRDNIYVTVQRSTRIFGASSAPGTYTQVERMEMIEPVFTEQGVYLDNSRIINSELTTGELRRPRVVDGTLQIHILSTISDDTTVRITGASGTPLQILDEAVFLVTTSGVDQTGADSGYAWFTLVRYDGDPTDPPQDFDPDGFFPESFELEGQVASILYPPDPATITLQGMAHLYARSSTTNKKRYRNGQIAVGLTSVPIAGTAATVNDFALTHAGELYTCEIETLDIDDPRDVITGAPLNTNELFVRFGAVRNFQYSRDRSNWQQVSFSALYRDPEFDFQLGFLRGVHSETLQPGWVRNGRVVIRNEDPWPFEISAISPKVQVGDLDL